MRFAAPLAGCVVGVGLVLGSTQAMAQLAPPPPLQAGGLVPPPRGSGPAAPLSAQSSPTQARLDEATTSDSGRGLDFAYFDVEGAGELVALDALHAGGSLLPDAEKHSSLGPLLGVGSGLRLLFFTVGPRFRYAHFTDWDLWTLNLEVGWRIPLGRLEPYGTLGGGYARLGHAADDSLGRDRGVAISGFDVRLGGGFDYYVSNVLSVGGTLSAELLRLSRDGVMVNATDPPQASVFRDSASSLGLTLTLGAVAGLHF